ncbi:hypothetical protein DSO57_1035770 [Entomophthora muscae]|uniref:Uncharacterized protein n=1 Tax=Entomophthora muscae TaxID=34485 RepID=A0ACC2TXW2_9FUNG|nr:hypothetical protein DSO57_1035770 [Entomophthora muscae]
MHFPLLEKDNPFQLVPEYDPEHTLGTGRQEPHTAAYLIPMKPPPTPKTTISTPPTSDAAGQSSQFLGVLYLALTGLIDSVLPEVRTWAVAGKALSYLIKLGPIIWWAMLVLASTTSSPAGALQFSWYPDNNQSLHHQNSEQHHH